MLRLLTNKSVLRYALLVLALVNFQTARADPLGDTVNGLTSSLTTGLTNGLFSGLRNTLTPGAASEAQRTRQSGAVMDPNNPQMASYNQQMGGYPPMNMYGGQGMGNPYGQMGAYGMGSGGPQPSMWNQAMPYGMPPPPPPYGMPPPPFGMMNPRQQYQQMQQPNNPFMMNPYQQQQQQQYGQLPNNMMNNYQQQPGQQPNNQMSQQLDEPMFARPTASRF